MIFGLDGVEISLIIVFATLFLAILSGFPVAFALSGAAIVSFALVALGNQLGWLVIDDGAGNLVPVLNYQLGLNFNEPNAWLDATKILAQWGSNTYIRAFGENQNDTLLAVPLFVLMGIALERSKIAEELLTSMASLFGGLPGGLAVSVVAVGALLAASTGIVGATVVTMGLISLPTMLRAGYSKELSTGVIATSGTLGQVIPPSIVLVLLGSMVGDIYSKAQKARSETLNIPLPELLGSDIAISTGTLFKAAFIPGVVLALLYAAYAMAIALWNPSMAPAIVSQANNGRRKTSDHYASKISMFSSITLPPIAFILMLVVSLTSGIVGNQEPTEDALEFANFQALLERVEKAKPNSEQNSEDFEILKNYVKLISRNDEIPPEIREIVDGMLADTDSSDLERSLRAHEIEVRRNDLVRGLKRFALALDAMLGEAEAKPYLQMLAAAKQSQSIQDLISAVDDAPLGVEVQNLLRKAKEQFDFAPYLNAAETYDKIVSKARRKNYKKLDDVGKIAEFAERKKLVVPAVESLRKFYAPFFGEETSKIFNEALNGISEAQDIGELVNHIRSLPSGAKLKRALEPAFNTLDQDALLASSFSYERAVREVASGEVQFGISRPIDGRAANLIRLAFEDLSDGRGIKELAAYFKASIDNYEVPRVSTFFGFFVVISAIAFSLASRIFPERWQSPLLIGYVGLALCLAVSIFYIEPTTDPWLSTAYYSFPLFMVFFGLKTATLRLMEIDVIRVIVPPVVLIVAVLGSIFGGLTNPTPAAALGAGGALLLSAIKLLSAGSPPVGPLTNKAGRQFLLLTAAAIALMLLLKTQFLDIPSLQGIGRSIASQLAIITYIFSIVGLIYAVIILLCAKDEKSPNIQKELGLGASIQSWLLSRNRLLPNILQETAKVSVMVFAILIGSQLLALTLRSFGGEEYIAEFLHGFEDPRTLLLVVMVVLFVLGFVLDFIEIIFIVIPIVGPVIYAADPAIMPPEWITILIAVNLQTSFITPPFGFALFYLRGVAPSSITTGHIYRGIIPFVIIQICGLALLWFFPQIVTFLPDLLPDN